MTGGAGGYYDERAETMLREELADLQQRLLVGTLKRVWEGSPFYRRKFQEAGMDPREVRNREDLTQLPTTTKSELVGEQLRAPPFGDLPSTPPTEFATVVGTTGTTGIPIFVPLTVSDSGEYCTPDSASWLRTLHSIGYSEDRDILQSAWNYGFWYFSASCLAFGRGRARPPHVITSIGRTGWQLQLMERLGITIFFATQSYVLYVGEKARELGVDPSSDLSVRMVVGGGEPGLLAIEGFRERMKRAWGDGVDCFESAGASEMGYLGQECWAHQGLHVPEDYLLVEVLDLGSGEPVGPGERGELCITHLRREAMPLVRYRIGDVTVYEDDVCGCGRTHLRLQGILGRTDDMIKVKGLQFFPSQVESVVASMPGCTGEFLIIVGKDQSDVLDTFRVQVEARCEDEEALTSRIERDVRALTGIRPEVELVAPGTMVRSPHKAVRLLDLRKEGAEEKHRKKLQYARRLD
jgi:phenylacetate-CoA ligase